MAQDKTGWSLDELRGQVKVLVNTLGKEGSVIYIGDDVVRIPSATPARVLDPTGAGDAYRAGLFAARQAGLPWDVAGRIAALCGTYALENVGPTGHHFTAGEFIARYTTNFGDEPLLPMWLLP
jgi:adenosine kinase